MSHTPVGELNLLEDWTFEVDLTRKNADTRKTEALTPATGWAAWFSATEDGSEIDADVKVAALTEATGKLGTVYGVVSTEKLVQHLTAYLGKTVWEVVDKPTDFRRSRPLIVKRIGRLGN